MRDAGLDTPTVRALAATDADAVAALIRRAFASQSVETDPPPSAMRVAGADIRAHLARGGGGGVVDGPLASALWIEAEGGLYIGRLAVDPSARRLGLARALLAAAEAEARGRGLPFLWLETRLVLADNRALFASSGFAEAGVHAHPGYAHPTFVRMVKELEG